MIFEIPYWKDRLQAAKTQEDFAQLLQDLPCNPKDSKSKDDQKSCYTEQPPILVSLILNTRKGNIVVG
jgi:hypothetical protein